MAKVRIASITELFNALDADCSVAFMPHGPSSVEIILLTGKGEIRRSDFIGFPGSRTDEYLAPALAELIRDARSRGWICSPFAAPHPQLGVSTPAESKSEFDRQLDFFFPGMKKARG